MAKTLYSIVANKLIEEIRAGHYVPGEPVPSSRDLRSMYGVSHLTAIRALSLLARKGILTHYKGRNYCVSRKTDLLSAGSQFLTLLFRYISFQGAEFYGNRILSGITLEAASAAIGSYFTPAAIQFSRFRNLELTKIIDDALALPKQNIGFISDFFVPDEILSEIKKETHLPIIVIGRASQLPEVHSVVLDVLPAYRSMMNTIKRLGYNAFICSESSDQSRYETQQQHVFFEELSLQEQNVLILDKFSEQSRAQRIEALEKSLNGFSGKRTLIFAFSDEEARLILDHLSIINIKVPEQVGVVGFYGTRLASDFSPKLCCLSVQPEVLGQVAAQLLISKDMRYQVHKIGMQFEFGETI